MNYFYADDQKKIIKEDLLTTKALEWAKQFAGSSGQSRGGNRTHGGRMESISATQLRRFYNDVKSLHQRADAMTDEGFKQLKPLVKMIKSKVAYSRRKSGGTEKVPECFRKYMDEMIDNINDKKDFEAFVKCFESVVGFAYGEGISDSGR